MTDDQERSVELQSELTCPACHHKSGRVMPTDACLFFHECEGCKTLLRPKPGDCCVFCSYGTVPCPPIQEARRTGRPSDCR
ncbi:MAG: GDCCVxC domain-containing (seleno)protein [Pseudomonadota bacterium]